MTGLYTTLMLLSAETTIAVGILAEDEGLITLIHEGKPYDALLDYCNESY